jgi:hypothetical protein
MHWTAVANVLTYAAIMAGSLMFWWAVIRLLGAVVM